MHAPSAHADQMAMLAEVAIIEVLTSCPRGATALANIIPHFNHIGLADPDTFKWWQLLVPKCDDLLRHF